MSTKQEQQNAASKWLDNNGWPTSPDVVAFRAFLAGAQFEADSSHSKAVPPQPATSTQPEHQNPVKAKEAANAGIPDGDWVEVVASLLFNTRTCFSHGSFVIWASKIIRAHLPKKIDLYTGKSTEGYPIDDGVKAAALDVFDSAMGKRFNDVKDFHVKIFTQLISKHCVGREPSSRSMEETKFSTAREEAQIRDDLKVAIRCMADYENQLAVEKARADNLQAELKSAEDELKAAEATSTRLLVANGKIRIIAEYAKEA